MGLTIHDQLKADTRVPNRHVQLVDKLRQRALDLPIAEVGRSRGTEGRGCDFETTTARPAAWLAIQAGQ